MPPDGTSNLIGRRRLGRLGWWRSMLDRSPWCTPSRIGAWAVALVLSASANPRPLPPAYQRFHTTHLAMGTEFTLDLYAADAARAAQVSTLAFDEVDRLEALLSNYRPSSELSRISRGAASGAVTTDPETFAFLKRSLFWSEQSGGTFDITVGPLLRLWGFFFNTGRVPADTELSALRESIGWRHVHLDPRTRSVSFVPLRPMELDPGSIGKGFAIDHVVSLLRQQGIEAAFLSAGKSTLYGLGAPPGKAGWPVRIPDPRHADVTVSTVLLNNASLSTGACTEKFFLQAGHRYCHIFDPRNLRPAEGMLQTTVLDQSATDSDALSTVVFVLSANDSERIIRSASGRSALLFHSKPDARQCLAINWPDAACARFHKTKDPTS